MGSYTKYSFPIVQRGNVKASFFPTLFVLILIFLSSEYSYAQYIPVHPQQNSVYTFLSEFPLDYNPSITPIGRLKVSEMLRGIDKQSLNMRQQKELDFYLKDFNKEFYPHKNFSRRNDLFYYRDSLFSFTINPIAGGNAWVNKNGFEYHWWNGAEAIATMGNWGFFVSLRDNHLSSKIFSPTFLDQQPPGSNFKPFSDGKIDFEEIRGGVTYAWKTGHVGIIKDNFTWGSGYNGANIFSGHTPAFARIDLNLKPVKWFEFNYVHAWLNSELIDSSRTFSISNGYGNPARYVYYKRFMAANMISLYPLKNLSISLGNSVIYDYDQVHPAYLIPVMFYKAVDHNLNSNINNMNSQMFIDISTKNIQYLHLFSTLFIDELAIKRINIKDEHNFASLKAGFQVTNLIPDVFMGFEYIVTNALTYQHFVPTTTFQSNLYNLGHYLTDNVKEIFMNIGWKPIRNMIIEVSYTDILKGPDHTALGTMPREKISPFIPLVYESQSLEVNASWQVFNDLYLRLGFEHRNVSGESSSLIQYSPEFYWGETNTLNFGVNYGF